MKHAKSKRQTVGQGLIEYLILVCLISVAAIAVVTVVGQNLRARYANISSALHGKKGKEKLIRADSKSYEMRGLDDFTQNARKFDGRAGWGGL